MIASTERDSTTTPPRVTTLTSVFGEPSLSTAACSRTRPPPDLCGRSIRRRQSLARGAPETHELGMGTHEYRQSSVTAEAHGRMPAGRVRDDPWTAAPVDDDPRESVHSSPHGLPDHRPTTVSRDLTGYDPPAGAETQRRAALGTQREQRPPSSGVLHHKSPLSFVPQDRHARAPQRPESSRSRVLRNGVADPPGRIGPAVHLGRERCRR